jgi:3-deoxy-D-manno-octulosonic acid (KDO) 8-phosphate synthase
VNWINVVFLIVRALCLSGAAYAGAKGQSELAATLGAAAGAITVTGSYVK